MKNMYVLSLVGGMILTAHSFAEMAPVINPEETGAAVFKLTVTDSAGNAATAEADYVVGEIDPAKLYIDKATWTAAVAPKMRKQAAFAFVERNPDLPNVLLIGDSISIGYTPYVREQLNGKCNVYRIPENGGDSRKALAQFDFWMGDNQWDVIHFNTGLHDMKRIVDNKLNIKGDRVNSPAAYRKNLEAYFQRMETTDAKLIWANTTVVPENAGGRIRGEEVLYNGIAQDLLKEHSRIRLNDLYALTDKYPGDQKPANVHFEDVGKERQGRQVAREILKALE